MAVAKEEGEFDRDIYDGKVAFDPENGVRADHPKAADTETAPAS